MSLQHADYAFRSDELARPNETSDDLVFALLTVSAHRYFDRSISRLIESVFDASGHRPRGEDAVVTKRARIARFEKPA